MKKGIKITLIVTGILLAVLIILPLAFVGKFENIVKSEGNKMLNAEFDFKSLNISLLRNFPKASITLKDFWMKGAGEFENDTLVRSGEVSVALNLLSLFGQDGFEISKIAIRETWLQAIVLPDGKANWDIMKENNQKEKDESPKAGEESQAFKISLKEFVIDNLNLSYDDRQANNYAELKQLSGKLSGDLGSDRTTIQLEAETPQVTYKSTGIPLINRARFYARMKIDADLENQKFTLEQNELHLNAIQAGVDGWVALGENNRVDMDLSLNSNQVGFKEILSLIPAIYMTDFKELQTNGEASLTAYAKGTLQGDTLPQFDASLKVTNAMFRYPQLPAGVDQINVLARATNPGGSADLTEITIDPFNFRMAGNPFRMTAEIRTPASDAAFKGKAQGVLNLGNIKDVYPLEDIQLNGRLDADIAMEGRMSYVEKEQYDKFTASGNVKLSDMKLALKEMPEIDIQQSSLTFTSQYLQLSETIVKIGENDLTINSRLENYMGYAFKNSTIKGSLNLRSERFNLNDFMSGTVVESAAADTAATAMGAIVIPQNIDFAMEASMKQVLLNKMAFNDVKGKILVKGGKADMQNLSTNMLGGTVVINGYYSSAKADDLRLNANFRMSDLSFAQVYKELELVQSMAPVFENLKGNFSGNISIDTQLDQEMSPVLPSVTGNGSLSTKDLSLSNVKVIDEIAEAVNQPKLKEMNVQDMKINFVIADGRVTTEPFDLKWNDYVINLSGSTGLDESISYKGKVQLPASNNLSQYTTFDLKIGGTFNSPKVSVDMESMAKQAVEKVKDQAIEKLGELLGGSGEEKNDSTKSKEKSLEKSVDAIKGLFKKK